MHICKSDPVNDGSSQLYSAIAWLECNSVYTCTYILVYIYTCIGQSSSLGSREWF